MKDYYYEQARCLKYIQKRASRGKHRTSMKLYFNQAKYLVTKLGFKVTINGKNVMELSKSEIKKLDVEHEMRWYTIDCKGAECCTVAWTTYKLVRKHYRGKARRSKKRMSDSELIQEGKTLKKLIAEENQELTSKAD